MKKNLLILLFVGLGCWAQNSREIDSLKQITESSTNDSIVMDTYNKLRRATYYNDPTASKEYTFKYLESARKRKDSHHIVLAHFFLGNAQLIDGSYEKATRNYLVGAHYYQSKKDTARLTSVYNSLGAMYEKTENDSLSLHYYSASKRLAQLRKDYRRSGIASVNIGNIYTNRNEPEKAIAFLKEAVNDLDDNPNYLSFLNMAKINLGAAFLANKNPDEAINVYNEVLSQIDTLENPYLHANVLEGLSNSYRDQNKDATALKVGEKAFQLYVQHNYLDEQLQMLPDLISTYRKNNRLEEALLLFDTYQGMKDSLLVATNNQQITDAVQKYETEKKDAQLQVLTLEKQQEQEQKMWFGALAVAGILLAGIIGFFLQKNRRKNKLLDLQKNQLEKALNEKEILLKEIHHRVKNNLQVISSLLSLQQRQLNDSSASEAIQIGRDRVKAMSLIHQNLYQDGDLVGVSIKEYIEKLTQNLVRNYQIEDKPIDLQLDIASSNLDVDTIIPLGLIINELISNALKYAFTKKDSGRLTVKLMQQEKTLQLSVADNGIGLPNSFKPKESNSLGYRLIHAFSDKLKAVLNISSSSEGTVVTLQIPYIK